MKNPKNPEVEESVEICGLQGYDFMGWQIDARTNKRMAKCLTLGHAGGIVGSTRVLREMSHNMRGSNNTAWCPVCKIFWKYDSSD